MFFFAMFLYKLSWLTVDGGGGGGGESMEEEIGFGKKHLPNKLVVVEILLKYVIHIHINNLSLY